MRDLMLYLREKLALPNKGDPVDLSAGGHRYALYKEGPVLCVSHGVGSSTFSVVLHELLKLVRYAKCHDPVFLRIGTCGGVGIAPGTVVVTKDAFNGYLRNEHEIVSKDQCGKHICIYLYKYFPLAHFREARYSTRKFSIGNHSEYLKMGHTGWRSL